LPYRRPSSSADCPRDLFNGSKNVGTEPGQQDVAKEKPSVTYTF